MAASNPSLAEGTTPREVVEPQKIEFIDLKSQQERVRPGIDAAIKRVLDHGQYIMGPEVGALESALAQFCGSRFAISCASGTDALLIAMMAEGIGPGDAVFCPAFTYTATPETIALLGATPVFVDVDDATFNLDPDKLRSGLDTAVQAKLRPKAIIAVDLFGQPADYARIDGFAAEHGLWVLADGAQSFGASRNGSRVGNFGKITATSFFPAKPLGCFGDGGAIFAGDAALADKMASIRLHGKGEDKYDIVRIGVNGRLDTLQAAVLLEKLKIFQSEIDARQVIAERYTRALSGVVATPVVEPNTTSVWAQYTIRLPAGARDKLATVLKSQGIPTNVYYPRPVHHQTPYRQYPIAGNGVPVAERLPNEVLSLPMHPYLSDTVQARIMTAIQDAVSLLELPLLRTA